MGVEYLIFALISDYFIYIILGIIGVIFLVKGMYKSLLFTTVLAFGIGFSGPVVSSRNYAEHEQKVSAFNILPETLDVAGKSILYIEFCYLSCANYDYALEVGDIVGEVYAFSPLGTLYQERDLVSFHEMREGFSLGTFDIPVDQLIHLVRDPRPENKFAAYIDRNPVEVMPDIDLIVIMDGLDMLSSAHADKITAQGFPPKSVIWSFAIAEFDGFPIDLATLKYQLLLMPLTEQVDKPFNGWQLVYAPREEDVDRLLDPLLCAHSPHENCGYPYFSE